MKQRILCIFLVILSNLFFSQLTFSADTNPSHTKDIVAFSTDQPIWAFGDIHGAYDEWVKLLQANNIIDSDLNWSAGKAQLVSTGDILDRGPNPRKALDLMMKLEKQAQSAGGAFHLVLGNHEVMILLGDLRYVAPFEYLEFADDETPQMREKYFQQYLDYQTRFLAKKGQAIRLDLKVQQTSFNKQHPLGFFARFEAFSKQGKYGSWLLSKPVIIKINDNIFTHGGLSPALKGKSLEAINSQLKSELVTYLNSWHQLIAEGQLPVASLLKQRHELLVGKPQSAHKLVNDYQQLLLLSRNSPTWYRGATFCHPYYENQSLNQLLNQFSAKRLFLGHTVTNSRKVEKHLDGQVFTMDTGMLKAVYRGRGNITRILGDRVESFNSDSESYQPKLTPHIGIQYPSELSHKELETLLQSGKISRVEQLKTGITEPFRLTFEHPTAKIRALFKNIDTDPRLERRHTKLNRELLPDRYHFDIAAYRLSELLGFHLVPLSVEREVKGTKGVVQYWLENSYSEYSAKEQDIKYMGYCSQWQQNNMMRIFDLLIYNVDRNQTNILFEADRDQMVWIDHSRAFADERKLPKNIKRKTIKITPKMREALLSLSFENLEPIMKELLNRRQIRKILKRRDKILRLDPID